MPKSLEEISIPVLHTESDIILASQSSLGEKAVWCVTEGEDYVVYAKFFDYKTVQIYMPDSVSKGYNYVETTVSDILNNTPIRSIFGIRDCDYTRYEGSYKCPQNVFLTDTKDLETLMFCAPSVLEGLKNWNESFPKNIGKCLKVCRYLGYLRIYNYICDTGCDFRKNCRISSVWDFSSQSLKLNAEQILIDKFTSSCDFEVTERQVMQFITDMHLDGETSENVCSGHDVITLLSHTMVKIEYHQDKIFDEMTDSYSYEDFCNTALCRSIESWAENNGVKVLRG